MTKRRTKPRPSKKRAAPRGRSGKGQTWLIAAIVLIALMVISAGLWLIGARPGQSATASLSQFQRIENLDQLPPGQAEHVEVAYFHRTHRCAGCIEAERLIRKTFDIYFTDHLESGEVSLVVADVQKQENAALAQKYNAYSSSLYLGIIKEGVQYIWPVSDIWFAMRDESRFMALLCDKINLGVLIPMAFGSAAGFTLPLLFGIGTGVPVLVLGVPLALGLERAAAGLNLLGRAELVIRKVAAWTFIGAGVFSLARFVQTLLV